MAQTATTYNWSEAANQESGEHAEKLPNGTHDLEIVRIVYGKKDSPVFRSRGGDPQIMLIFADDLGREASQMVTLSFKAGWVLAKILRAAGADLDRMGADGVIPPSFAEPEFANANLIGRRLRAEVTWTAGRDKKEYADIVPIGPVDPSQAPAETQGETDDEIPI